MDFFKSAQKNFKMAKKGVEISTTPKILGGKKKCCKKLLATKNVVFQHLLPIYETIFEIYSCDFGPKMAIFGPPRQKFLPDATSEDPGKKFSKTHHSPFAPFLCQVLEAKLEQFGRGRLVA